MGCVKTHHLLKPLSFFLLVILRKDLSCAVHLLVEWNEKYIRRSKKKQKQWIKNSCIQMKCGNRECPAISRELVTRQKNSGNKPVLLKDLSKYISQHIIDRKTVVATTS